MEEYGCTSDSLQYYYEAGLGALITSWNLDMITDPQGNQIHFTYQQDMESWTSSTTGKTYSYPRDTELHTISYDSPGCHNAQTMCTGSAWAPQMQVVFDASHSPALLSGSRPSGCNTGANLRCDDPLDLSSSGGEAASLIQNTYVLNSVQVQVRTSGSGSWNTLNTYQLGYEQSGPSTITDPANGQQRSVAGMLDLTSFQQVGSTNATALMYSGMDNNATTSYAYMQVFDLSSKNVVIGPDTTLSYWIYPQSSAGDSGVSGSNSSCVAIDAYFTDGSDLRDSGVVDQNGNQLHPAHQCGHLALDQWNYVTADLGAKLNGKTFSVLNVGYDQPANTGGYRGYIDDIEMSNPDSSTPLFATDFESGSPQPTWTNTAYGTGAVTNVGGICCGLAGPEMGTRQEKGHTDSAALPLVTFRYTNETNTYVDSFFKPNATAGCGPSWNTGNNGSGCLLWEQTYAGNDRFLSAVSNGQGLFQTFTYAIAHNNSHGAPGGGAANANPLACDSSQSGYPCDEADDSGWSHAVLTAQSSTTTRVTQNGQVGAQNSLLSTQGTNDGNWNNVRSFVTTRSLDAGNNTILFSNPSSGAFDVDHIVVNGVSYEAESSANTLAGGARILSCSACSGGNRVGFIGAGGTLQFNGINVSTAGTYPITIYYLDGDGNRSSWMTVDGTLTPITETTNYSYQLNAAQGAAGGQQCSDCLAGMYWGNQNDDDYLGFYNATFMGFAQAKVDQPSGEVDVHDYYSGEGWGIYDTGQVTCYTAAPCHADPWWALANAAHGDEYKTVSYDADGTTPLKEVDTTYTTTCPPSGVSGTPASSTWGNWDGKLVSSLDHNNPVAACQIEQTQQITQTFDGASNPVTTTTNWTYDNYGRVTQATTTSNGGTPAEVVKNTAYVWNDNVSANSTSASGTYIIDKVASSDTEDGAGNQLSCNFVDYDGPNFLTGQTSSLTEGLATNKGAYTDCANASNNYEATGFVSTVAAYDVYGDVIGSDDADADANMSSHYGCQATNSNWYTTCATYDGTFDVFPTSSTNDASQTTSTSYGNTSALFGYGTWPASTTDVNSQTTSVTYDALGRMTSETLPGETSSEQTKQWVYTNWCSGTGVQAPCEEIDEIDRLDSGTTVTSRAFYDGEGRLVETRSPGPAGQSKDVVTFAFYDTAGRQIFKSDPYFVSAYTGTPGAAAYSIPDTTQPGTSTTYPNLRTTSVTDPNSHTTTSTESVICGVAGTSDTGCYVQTMKVDANGHEVASLMGGAGNLGYFQFYTGNSPSTYTLYSTTSYQYDAAGNAISSLPPDGTTTQITYDDLGRVISKQDPDSGTTSYTYDPNGNVIESADARGSAGTVYTGYDGLNRPLWQNSTNSVTGAWVTYTYDSTANGNDGIGQLTSESFTGSGGLSGSYAYTYDARGQQTAEAVTVNGTNYSLTSTYNDNGQVTSETYPTGEIVTPGYDNNGWQLGLSTQSGSGITTIASNLAYSGLAGAAGQITKMDFGSGDTYTASFDSGMHLTSASLTQASTGELLYHTQPAYDAANNVVSVQTSINGATDAQQFCYDSLNRLTWAGSIGTPPCATLTSGTLAAAQYQQSDSYDVNRSLTSGPGGSYVYGNSSHPHALVTTSNGYSAAYNAAGDETCRALTSATTCGGSTPTGQQLSYDAEGRLTSWQNTPTSPTSTANYLYDGSGNRVAAMTTVNGTTTLTTYIGGIEEVQKTGSTTTTTTYYSVGGQRVAANVNGTFYYFGYDALGSQVAVFNSSGNLIGSQLYGSYGNQRYANGSLPTSIGFTGQQADSITGLDYYKGRYYDPTVGIFLSPDPVIGNLVGLNPYSYVEGNPETYRDPSGYMPTDGPIDPELFYQLIEWIVNTLPNGISIANIILTAALLGYNVGGFVKISDMPNDTDLPSAIKSFTNGNQSPGVIEALKKLLKGKNNNNDGDPFDGPGGGPGGGSSDGVGPNGNPDAVNRKDNPHNYDRNKQPAGKNGPNHNRNVGKFRVGDVITDVGIAALWNAVQSAIAAAAEAAELATVIANAVAEMILAAITAIVTSIVPPPNPIIEPGACACDEPPIDNPLGPKEPGDPDGGGDPDIID